MKEGRLIPGVPSSPVSSRSIVVSVIIVVVSFTTGIGVGWRAAPTTETRTREVRIPVRRPAVEACIEMCGQAGVRRLEIDGVGNPECECQLVVP